MTLQSMCNILKVLVNSILELIFKNPEEQN